jgi:hypothetical protein
MAIWLAPLVLGPCIVAVADDTVRPVPAFEVPRDRAQWEPARAELRRKLRERLGGLPERPDFGQVTFTPEDESHRGCIGVEVRPKSGPSFRGLKAVGPSGPSGFVSSAPTVIFMHGRGTGKSREILQPGPSGESIAEEFTRRGFAVICMDSPLDDDADPWTSTRVIDGLPAWAAVLRADLQALNALGAHASFDTSRVAVVGHDLGSARALWLTALDDRVKCGFAIGNVTRLSDWLASQKKTPAPWLKAMLQDFDTDAVAALCAPRALNTFAGTEDPASPMEGVRLIRQAYDRAMRLYPANERGPQFQFTYGAVGGEFTLLEWDSMMEFLDKALMPQVATPLPHAPSPEPVVDERFIDLAERGIAGWVPEMSQRPGTWTWRDGVIVCRPGNNEYGWLRAPVEVEDFILSLDWKVPRNGNSGVFLRSRPVFWTIPSTQEGKLLVETKGLEWPSRTGFELQAADGFGPASKYSTASLYRHAAPSDVPMKPAGEWNHYTVRARGPRIEVWLNGEQVQDTRIDQLPTLRRLPLKGYIGLQNHGNGAEFRNVRYLRLEPGAVD